MARGKHFKRLKKTHKFIIFILLIVIAVSIIYIANYYSDKEEVVQESEILNTIEIDETQITPEKTERIGERKSYSI